MQQTRPCQEAIAPYIAIKQTLVQQCATYTAENTHWTTGYKILKDRPNPYMLK